MSEKEHKRFMLAFFAMTGALLVLAAVYVILFDPFFHYHANS